ncbi:MAG: amidohydrolase family protein [Paracoccaceae bacterium]
MILDAHHHFWHPARGDYDWMRPDDPVLAHPFGPAQMAPVRTAAGVGQTVLVQAAPTLAETHYLLGIADATPHIAGVVGWVDFDDPTQATALQALARHPKLLGLRPMIQNLPADDWALGPQVQWAFEMLCELDLSFDALGFPRHIPIFAQLCARYPTLRVVLDHGLKPQIRDGAFEPWADGMADLAAQSSAYVKLSGLVTETDTGCGCGPDALRPYVDHLLACFGPNRVMWGSDWPVCTKRTSYADWLATAQTLTAHLPKDARTAIFANTARRFYKLKDTT